jgi:WD40 repeat protein
MAIPPSSPDAVTLPPSPTQSFQSAEPVTETLPAGSDTCAAPVVLGYEILDELGRGGMGVVYKARQVQLQRVVALKMILAGSHAGTADLARFRTEAQAIARLQHANIVQIHEVGVHEGKPYFSLEFCGGGSLAQKINGTPLAPKEAARLVETLARGMDAAHQKNIIHRDLKPANVLLLEDGTPKITDFGLAKKLDDVGQTQSGAIMGTPSYMAPEQAGGKSTELGPAADIYALGAILYELLTGRPPFKASTPFDTILQVMTDDPVPPTQLQSKTPKDLETICLKCLQKEPGKRYADATALAEDLRRFQAGEPIQARPVGSWERTWRWCRRNPLLAGSVTAVALSLLLGTVVATWFAIQAEANLQQALMNEQKAVDEKQKADQARERVEMAEREAKHSLFQARLEEARGRRFSGQVGRRFESLKALAEAARLAEELKLPAEKTLAVRNEAIACMVLPDLRIAKEWHFGENYENATFDSKLEMFARSDLKGEIQVCRVENNEEIGRLSGAGIHAWELRFSPNREFLGAYYHNGRIVLSFIVWDVKRRQAIRKFEAGQLYPFASYDYSPDSKRVAFRTGQKAILIFDAVSGADIKLLATNLPPQRFAFDPQGNRLAVCSLQVPGLEIHDLDTGKILMLPHGTSVRGLAWRGDGKRLATAGGDGNVYLWNLEEKAPKPSILKGHRASVTQVAFNHAGNLLASNSHDGTTRLWDPVTGQQLLQTDGSYFTQLRFGSDDRFLFPGRDGPKTWFWEVSTGPGCQKFFGHKHKREFDLDADIAPSGPLKGRLMASAGEDGFRLWHLWAGKEWQKLITFLPRFNAHSTVFHPDGRSLITSCSAGIFSWPLKLDADGTTLHMGPARRLLPGYSGDIFLSPDGGKIAVGPRNGIAFIGSLDEKAKDVLSVQKEGHVTVKFVALHASGKWLATGNWHGAGVHIWKGDNGEFVQRLEIPQSARPAFSPDGQWLVASNGQEYRFWRVGSWERGLTIARKGAGDMPGKSVFSQDGKLLAVAFSRTLVKIVNPATGKEYASLPTTGGPLCFSPDASQLVTSAQDGDLGVIEVWDLRVIRQQMAEMKLDWDFPPYPPAIPAGKPFEVKVDLGDYGK